MISTTYIVHPESYEINALRISLSSMPTIVSQIAACFLLFIVIPTSFFKFKIFAYVL